MNRSGVEWATQNEASPVEAGRRSVEGKVTIHRLSTYGDRGHGIPRFPGHIGQKRHSYPQSNPQRLSTVVKKVGRKGSVALAVTLDDSGLGLDSGGEVGHLVEQTAALGHQLANFSVSVHHRGVIAATKSLTDFWQ
jgi:hypothetical protein